MPGTVSESIPPVFRRKSLARDLLPRTQVFHRYRAVSASREIVRLTSSIRLTRSVDVDVGVLVRRSTLGHPLNGSPCLLIRDPDLSGLYTTLLSRGCLVCTPSFSKASAAVAPRRTEVAPLDSAASMSLLPATVENEATEQRACLKTAVSIGRST